MLLAVLGQPGLHCKFQISQSYIEDLVRKEKTIKSLACTRLWVKMFHIWYLTSVRKEWYFLLVLELIQITKVKLQRIEE